MRETDYDDAIYEALKRQEYFTHSELYDEVRSIKKTCSTRTFAAHLKDMVAKGIVLYKPKTKKTGLYYLDSVIKTKHILVKNMSDDIEEKRTDLSIQEFQTLLEAYSTLKKGSWARKDLRSHILEVVTADMISLFSRQSLQTFQISSGFYPKMVEKDMRQYCEYRIKKVENFFNNLKKLDPKLHTDICNSIVNKMLHG